MFFSACSVCAVDVGAERAGRRIAPGLAGDEDELAEDHAGGIRAHRGRKVGAGYGLHLVGHPVILAECRKPCMHTAHRLVLAAVTLVVAPPSALRRPGDPLKDAAALGRTQDDALFEAFNKSYSLTPSGTDRARRDHHGVPARGSHRARAAR